jgi:hypothetical protein
MYSGIHKAWFDEKTLVQKGQTGVEGLPKGFIKFIGVSEVLGATALIAPMVVNQWTFLTPIAAICLGFIMIPAAYIHTRRKELRNVMVNVIILAVCGLIAYFRMK